MSAIPRHGAQPLYTRASSRPHQHQLHYYCSSLHDFSTFEVQYEQWRELAVSPGMNSPASSCTRRARLQGGIDSDYGSDLDITLEEELLLFARPLATTRDDTSNPPVLSTPPPEYDEPSSELCLPNTAHSGERSPLSSPSSRAAVQAAKRASTPLALVPSYPDCKAQSPAMIIHV